MSEMSTDPGEKSVSQIEHEVDRKREDLSTTIDALQDKFSVETAIEKVVTAISTNGGEVSRNLGRTIRDNPIPLILTGIGLAWLIADSNQPSSEKSLERAAKRPDRPHPVSAAAALLTRAEPRRGRVHGGRPEFVDRGASGAPSFHAGTAAGDGAEPVESSSAVDSVKDATGSLKQKAGDLGERAQDYAEDAWETAGDTAVQVSDRVEKLISDQPLVIAALGFAAGLGLGSLLPHSRMEDELFGEQSDAVVDTLEKGASAQFDRVKAVAGAVAGEAMTIVEEEADEIEQRTPGKEVIADEVESKLQSASERLNDAGSEELKEQQKSDGST